LSELNPDVKCTYLETNFDFLLNPEKDDYFKNFNMIIATQLNQVSISNLKASLSGNKMLF
jgi:hypothetical protein